MYWKEQHLYGSSRLGIWEPGALLGSEVDTVWNKVGVKRYELVNHLGNVLSTVSDKAVLEGDHYVAEVLSAGDYYPFGMGMMDRKYSLGGYRYGFNGKEKSDEIAGEGNHNTAEFWEYDPRVGRRWNLDPVSRTSISDYSALGNNPIINVDPNGALFFGLFGSTSEQRQSAKSFASSSGGEVRNKWSSKIHVNYDQSSVGSDGVFTVTNSNQHFRRNGRLELGSAIANQEYDKQYEYEISHGTDKNGKRYFMPASGRAEYVPVESVLVPLPPVLAIVQEYKMVSFFSVQGATDVARLLKGGTPWPTAALRGQWGEGLYAWGTKAEAQAYLDGYLSRGIADMSIVEFKISRAQLSALKTHTIVEGTEEATLFFDKFSRIYGEGAAHGFDYLKAQTGNYGVEHFLTRRFFIYLKDESYDL